MNREQSLTVFALGAACQLAHAATYQLVPSDLTVLPGSTQNLSVQVKTEPGDNVVGVGYFSFAIDLSIGGTSGADASDISDVLINALYFDDLLGLSTGSAVGNQYLGIAGVTTDLFAPNFGRHVGDQVPLFTFDFTVPAEAGLGDIISITPLEGIGGNLIPDNTFSHVIPQQFETLTFNVVPELGSLALLGMLVVGCVTKRSFRL